MVDAARRRLIFFPISRASALASSTRPYRMSMFFCQSLALMSAVKKVGSRLVIVISFSV
jgi:hypothetical protein